MSPTSANSRRRTTSRLSGDTQKATNIGRKTSNSSRRLLRLPDEGVEKKAIVEALEEFEELAAHLLDSEKVVRYFIAYFEHRGTSPAPSEQTAVPAEKRRRLAQKQTSPEEFESHGTTYVYTRVPSRRFLQGIGCQGLPRRVQRVLLPHTVDLDIKNAMFTLSWQLVESLGIVETDVFREELETLERLCKNRENVIATELGLELAAGKASC